MTSLVRLLGYAALLLVVFLATALAAQTWLQHQTDRLRAEAIDAKRLQFQKTLALVAPVGANIDAATVAVYIQAVAAGEKPAPGPVDKQVALLLQALQRLGAPPQEKRA
ncbi:MAG: hypothetical protein CFE45_25065 [Burkholderiales bacterium PBB5]|nr:MAG: hypothetical protein CFE45_25065 [Burkholderiales bacterium PBB5]